MEGAQTAFREMRDCVAKLESQEAAVGIDPQFMNAVIDMDTLEAVKCIVKEISDISIMQVDTALATTAEKLRVAVGAEDSSEFKPDWCKDLKTYPDIAEALNLLTSTNLKDTIHKYDQVYQCFVLGKFCWGVLGPFESRNWF